MLIMDLKDLKYLKDLKEPIKFNKETIMVMCYTPQVIVFETSSECRTFKRVWEEIIADYVEKHEELDPTFELEDIAGWYVDNFEQEAWLVEDNKYKGRKAEIILLTDEEAKKLSWESCTATYFGVLNSGDIFTDMDTLKTHCKLIRIMFGIEEMNKILKDETRKMFEDILKVWEDDLRAFNSGSDYFKVLVKID